jgi:radical SAM protein with 4Fe4S-binding SPASM domain
LREIKEHLGDELHHSKKYVDYLVESTLHKFETNLLLYWKNEKLDNPYNFNYLTNTQVDDQHYLSAPVGLIWEITRGCNLKCKHCFSDSGRTDAKELMTEEIKAAIDLFADQKVFYINLTGGEPLLRSDLFEILHYASSKKISIDLSTNGYLVTAKTVALLQETNVFQVQLSIDGIGDMHDRFRGVKGSFQRALDAIKLLKQANFGVIISTTVNKTNIAQISRLIDLSLDVGASVFKTTLFIPTGRGKSSQHELSLDSDDVRRLALLMAAKEEEVSGQLVLKKDGFYPWLLEENHLPDPAWLRAQNVGCAAGTSSLFITADGNVVPCPFLRHLVIGNLRRDDFSKLWDSDALNVFRTLKPGDLKGKCSQCEYLGKQCYGGCRAAALAYSGDLYGEDPLCWKRN